MEKARRKAKIIESKFKIFAHISFDKKYSNLRKPPQSANMGTSRYMSPHLREGEKPIWKPK